MKINGKILFIFFFIVAVGICTGAFFEVFMKGDGKEALAQALGNLLSKGSEENVSENPEVMAKLGFLLHSFWQAIRIDLLILLVAYLSPLIPLFLPLLPLSLLIKGMTLGFSAALTLEIFGVEGVKYILITLLPHNLIQVPLLCLLMSLSVSLGVAVLRALFFSGGKRAKNSKNALQEAARQYSFFYGAGLVILILSCIPEVFLKP